MLPPGLTTAAVCSAPEDSRTLQNNVTRLLSSSGASELVNPWRRTPSPPVRIFFLFSFFFFFFSFFFLGARAQHRFGPLHIRLPNLFYDCYLEAWLEQGVPSLVLSSSVVPLLCFHNTDEANRAVSLDGRERPMTAGQEQAAVRGTLRCTVRRCENSEPVRRRPSVRTWIVRHKSMTYEYTTYNYYETNGYYYYYNSNLTVYTN